MYFHISYIICYRPVLALGHPVGKNDKAFTKAKSARTTGTGYRGGSPTDGTGSGRHDGWEIKHGMGDFNDIA